MYIKQNLYEIYTQNAYGAKEITLTFQTFFFFIENVFTYSAVKRVKFKICLKKSNPTICRLRDRSTC